MVELHHSSVAYNRFSQGVFLIFQIKKHGIQLPLDFRERCFACDSIGDFILQKVCHFRVMIASIHDD